MVIEITEENAQAFLDMLLRLDLETKNMMYEPKERLNNIEQVRNNIRTAITLNNLLLGVVLEDELVGFLSATKGTFRRNRHSAYLVIGLLEKARSKGLGSMLFERLLLWATEQGLSRVELTVLCHNTAAIALYQKYGFEIEGTKRHSLLIDRTYMDEYYMGLLL